MSDSSVGLVALPVVVSCCFLRRANLSYIDMYLSHILASVSAYAVRCNVLHACGWYVVMRSRNCCSRNVAGINFVCYHGQALCGFPDKVLE